MDFQLSVAARTLWQEARGEPAEGKQAVAHVFINRRNSGRWGNNLATVCLWHHQFSAWGPVVPTDASMRIDFEMSCELLDNDPQLVALAAIIEAAEHEPDPTNQATHYYRPLPGVPAPPWAATATPCGQFGHQLFFKNVH